jgi:4-hydroxy-2-oxoheptanedioate aldolase
MFLHYVTNPGVAEILPDEGLDFVIVNDEHNALDMGDFHGMQYAVRAKGIACLVRIRDRNPDLVAKACDGYPDGVVVPYVEEVEEARRLMGAAKYRPLKGEALERLLETGEYPSEKSKAWIEEKCADTLFVPMIESVRAVENLDAICSLPDVDAVLVGPNDLTISMGIVEERDSPDFVAMIQRIVDTAERHGVAAGVHFSSLDHATRLIEQGGRFIAFSSDLRMIQEGAEELVATLGGGESATREEKVI